MKKYVPPYPLIACDEHAGDPLPGYIICRCLVANPKKEAAPIERATVESVGVVICTDCERDCDERGGLPVSKMTTACAHFVHETFGVPL